MSDPTEELAFVAASIYGASTRRGLVEVTLGATRATVTPAKAVEMATFLLEAAASAEGDEILMRVLDRAGLSPPRAAQVMLAVRQERAIIQRRARREAREALAYDRERADPDAPEEPPTP